MTTSYLSSRTLDVRRLASPSMSAADVVEMTSLMRRLSYSAMGKRLLEVALTHELQLTFVSLVRLWYPGRGVAGAQYCPGRRVVRIGRGLAVDRQLALLAHELQHFCDEVLGWGTGWTVDSEVRAFQSEALVIQQLALGVASHALDDRGALLAREHIVERVRSLRLYSGLRSEHGRPNGRLHPLVDNDQLRPGRPSSAAALPSPVLVAGPRVQSIVRYTDTAWCPTPDSALT